MYVSGKGLLLILMMVELQSNSLIEWVQRRIGERVHDVAFFHLQPPLGCPLKRRADIDLSALYTQANNEMAVVPKLLVVGGNGFLGMPTQVQEQQPID